MSIVDTYDLLGLREDAIEEIINESFVGDLATRFAAIPAETILKITKWWQSSIADRTADYFGNNAAKAVKHIQETMADYARRVGSSVSGIPSTSALAEDAVSQFLKRDSTSTSYKELVKQKERPTLAEVFGSLYNDLWDSKSSAREWDAGAELFFMVLLIQLAIGQLAAILLGGGLVTVAFMACVVAPITEEYARRLALQQGYGLSGYTFILNVWEILTYVPRIVAGGASLGSALAIRLMLAIFHQIWGSVQKTSFVNDLRKNVSPEDAGQFGFFMAVALHSAWNTFAIILAVAEASSKK